MDQLPHYILVEILSYFSFSELLKLTKVSERWSHIIKTSLKLTKKFNLFGVCWPHTFYVQYLEPDLLYTNLTFIEKSYGMYNERIDTSIIFSICENSIRKYKHSLQKVNFWFGHNQIANVDILHKQLIIFVDVLKEIEIIDCMSLDSKEIKELKWRRLRSLKIHKALDRFLLFFKDSELEELDLALIKKSTALTFQEKDDLKLFWTKQTQTIKKLKIIKSEIDIGIIIEILKQQNLSKVVIDMKTITENIQLVTELSKICNWKQISFKNGPCKERNCKTVRTIIATHPCIDVLKFSRSSFIEKEDLILQIFSHLPKIEHLYLPLSYGAIQLVPKITFEKLTTLEIEGIKYRLAVDKLFLLLKMCTNLKTLKLHWIGIHARLNCTFFEKIFECSENIEELHVGAHTDTFELTDEILETIKNSGKKLRILTAFTENVELMREKMRIFHENGVKCTALDKNYEFPDDEKQKHQKPQIESEISQTSICEWSI